VRVVTAATAALILFSGSAWPEQTDTSEALTAQAHGVNLRALLLQVGARLHKTFVWDPRLPEKVDIGSLHEQDITYQELVSILRLNGLLVFVEGSTTEVMPDAFARIQPSAIVDPDQLKSLGDEIVTVLFPVKDLPAAQLVPILRPMVPQWGHLVAFPDRNALLITDRAANARRIIEIVRKLEILPKAPADSGKTP
jgi:general secretion pathway protein D